jgi:OOP family OmpA-OmpF porin
MRKALCVAGALALLPSIGHTQEFAPLPGFYIGAGVGGAWYLNSTTTIGGTFSGTTGMLADVVAGYDFVGPRVELEVGFGFIPFTANLANTVAQSNFSGSAHQLQVMGKALYDFIPASTITPSWATRCSPTRASSAWATTSTANGVSPSKAATWARQTRTSSSTA